MMKRIMLTVAYDGTGYNGWQIQPNGNTIEGQLNRALTELLGEEIAVIGASRTDAGVHALCNKAVFDTDSRIAAEKIAPALNARLPEDIRIQKSEQVADDFHPRHCNTRKTYEYRIYMGKYENPIGRQYAHFVYVPLDVEKMQKAADYLIGEHDFKSFCVAKAQVLTTVRTIYAVDVRKEGNYLTIRVSGSGFLFNMVRIIAGTLLEVGRGNLEPGQMQSILEAKERQAAGPTAPARGLTLVEFEFCDK
jgi:tRNA pseudouridine38-40 synthase